MASARKTLGQELENDISEIVSVYFREKDKPVSRGHTAAIWQQISRSNLPLRRHSKNLLEGGIERVIDSILAKRIDRDNEMPEPEEGLSDPINEHAVRQGQISGPSIPAAKRKREETRTKRVTSRSCKERQNKRQRREESSSTSIAVSPPISTHLTKLKGIDHITVQFERFIPALIDPEGYIHRAKAYPRGALLYGPAGCGKSTICKAFAAEIGVPFIQIFGSQLPTTTSREAENWFQEHLEKAKETAPSILFIDELEAIGLKRDESVSPADQKILAQLRNFMEELRLRGKDGWPVIVLAATNTPDSLNSALRGKFGTEISVGVPDEPARKLILKSLTHEIKLSEDIDFSNLAKRTTGFVASDLITLVDKAEERLMERYNTALTKQMTETNTEAEGSAVIQNMERLIKRLRNRDMPCPEGFEDAVLLMEDFEAAIVDTLPCHKRDVFATTPKTTWSDVGALVKIRQELEMAIVEPIKDPQKFARYGISTPTGVLLWGPPGCGKTLLAKAVAAESKANFISVNGPELLSKYVGESERAIRNIFMRARSLKPCLIFFDEFDALAPERSAQHHESSSRVIATLLAELDGTKIRDNVYLMAATNRPEIIDKALLRPGRMETLLYVEPPEPKDRVAILRVLLKQRGLDHKLSRFGCNEACDRFSGADLASLLRKAGQHAMGRNAENVEESDLEAVVHTVRPSVSDVAKYENLREEFESKVL